MWIDLMAHLDSLHQIRQDTRSIEERLDSISAKVDNDKLWVKQKKKLAGV